MWQFLVFGDLLALSCLSNRPDQENDFRAFVGNCSPINVPRALMALSRPYPSHQIQSQVPKTGFFIFFVFPIRVLEVCAYRSAAPLILVEGLVRVTSSFFFCSTGNGITRNRNQEIIAGNPII
jgi:hypothetical protein